DGGEGDAHLVVAAGQEEGFARARPADPGVAHRLRELLDARLLEGVTLDEAAGILHSHPTHLVRAFSGAFGIAPHQYLTARRLDRARRLLLDGRPPGEVATATGFYDQSHLNRSFKRLVGTTPGRFARSGGNPPTPLTVIPPTGMTRRLDDHQKNDRALPRAGSGPGG
ncbi:AraC family transcriptional regulator, partial [Streptomyces sp. NPDC013489]|uniref:helix-turn-helix domain-containing protein n=1 Tax=Streptomyces sp. NPDC013489 TaxID=3155606 RepID=UPI0033D35EAF